MSATACILYGDVPELLLITAIRHRDSVTGADLIAFDECPFSGEITETELGVQIAFPWPRNRTMRHAVGDWLTHYGINFTVVM
ncbi:phage portal protein [Burkholderia latens]|nr:phage portal protein [Burkholderia latens]